MNLGALSQGNSVMPNIFGNGSVMSPDSVALANQFGMGNNIHNGIMGGQQQANPWDFGNSLSNIGSLAGIANGIFGMYNQNRGMDMAQTQMDRQHKMAQHQQAQRDASINSWK